VTPAQFIAMLDEATAEELYQIADRLIGPLMLTPMPDVPIELGGVTVGMAIDHAGLPDDEEACP
jgi:hypothetical protein